MTERKQWKSTLIIRSKQDVEAIRRYEQERRKRFSKDMNQLLNIFFWLTGMLGNFAIFAWLSYFYIYEEIKTGIGVPYFYYCFICISLINCFIYCVVYNRSFEKN